MADFLDILARDAKETVASGYYNVEEGTSVRPCLSLKAFIEKCKYAPVIAEIKPSSPSRGDLRKIGSLRDIIRFMELGGAVGISILTEPKHFGGSLKFLAEARNQASVPLLMKDIAIDPVQVEAASKLGADAVLLIYSLFNRGYASCSLEEMIVLAHSYGLEVLLETHNEDEFKAALKTEANLIGVNNRDLKTLNVDLKVTKRVLTDVKDRVKIVVSESGVQTREDIRFLKKCGVDAFLVGSAVMLADNIEEKVRELVHAYENREG